MILIDCEAECAIHKRRFRARDPQLLSVRGIVRDCGVIEFVLARASTLACHVHTFSVRADSEIRKRVSPASAEPFVETDPLLCSVSRVISDRHVIELTGSGRRNPADINRAAVGTKGDDHAVVGSSRIVIPSC